MGSCVVVVVVNPMKNQTFSFNVCKKKEAREHLFFVLIIF